MLYLVLAIMIFIFLLIPYFESFSRPAVISFFGKQAPFASKYLIILTLGMVEGALIVLYIQSILSGMKQKTPNKFDL